MENSKFVQIKEKIKNFFDKTLKSKKDVFVGQKKPEQKTSPNENLKMY